VPACFIYLSSVGEESKVEELIPLFSGTWPYQHQRFFLVALQNSSDETLQKLISKISPQLRGTIRRIRENNDLKGNYISDYVHNGFEKIYDELNPYD
jgi:hypothetical protein